jgi:hypothetical protein
VKNFSPVRLSRSIADVIHRVHPIWFNGAVVTYPMCQLRHRQAEQPRTGSRDFKITLNQCTCFAQIYPVREPLMYYRGRVSLSV